MSTSRTRKSTAAATKATPAKATKATKSTQPKAASDGAKDWTYLADKAPTDLHEDMAAWITEVTGVEISAKAAQLVAVLRMEYQRSDRNKARTTYRGLDEVVVERRSVHMTQAAVEAREVLAKRKASEAPKVQPKAAPAPKATKSATKATATKVQPRKRTRKAVAA